MHSDPNNPVVKLCVEGMSLEATGQKEQAHQLFLRAWNSATNEFEKFTAAHYVARNQQNPTEKLVWDKLALELALKIEDAEMKKSLPSLYLNIAKGYEDLSDRGKAIEHYKFALSSAHVLADDGYGRMIHGGILNGLARTKV